MQGALLFWHVSLDKESSYATTFGSTRGRYRWLRMPFGISPAPEEFQQRLDQALAGLNECKAIADERHRIRMQSC